MRKRVGAGFFLSSVLPLVAASVWMMRLAGPSSRWVAIGIYVAGLGALWFAIRRHEKSQDRAGRGARALGTWLADNRGPLVAIVIFLAAGWVLTVLVPPG